MHILLFYYIGKFKDGITKEFSTELKPLSPEELLDLLKSKDHSGEIDKVSTCKSVLSEDNDFNQTKNIPLNIL